MANIKATALTALTVPPLYTDLVYVVRDPGGSPAARKQTHRNFMAGTGHNVLNYGAVGDAAYSDASGTDDTSAFSAAIAAAKAAGGDAYVNIPAGRTYKITSSLNSLGTTICGNGGLSLQGTGGGAYLVWGGASAGIPFDIAAAADNIQSTGFENFTILGRSDNTNRPNTMIKFRGTGGFTGAIDSGTYLRNMWLQNCLADDVRVEGGSTNFLISGGRFDDWGAGGSGYGLYATGGSNNITIDGEHTFAGVGDGMIFMDGETAGVSILKLFGAHLETNASLNQTYSGGTNPFDKRGLIRLGVNSALGEPQHFVFAAGIVVAESGGVSAHSLFQITASGGTDLANSLMVSIVVDNGQAISLGTDNAGTTDQLRTLGGRVPTAERPPIITRNIGRFEHNIGLYASSWINSADYLIRGLRTQPTTFANLPAAPLQGMRGFVTDGSTATFGSTVSGGSSNIVPVYYDGTNWKVG